MVSDSAARTKFNKMLKIKMSNKSKRKLPASDYKEAKKNWNKAKAKYELIKLIDSEKLQTKQRKNSTMIDVTLNGEQFSFNILKPLTDKFTKSDLQSTAWK